MILFGILLSIISIIAFVVMVATAIAGGSVLIVFGDLIVFCLIIYAIVKIFRKKK